MLSKRDSNKARFTVSDSWLPQSVSFLKSKIFYYCTRNYEWHISTWKWKPKSLLSGVVNIVVIDHNFVFQCCSSMSSVFLVISCFPLRPAFVSVGLLQESVQDVVLKIAECRSFVQDVWRGWNLPWFAFTSGLARRITRCWGFNRMLHLERSRLPTLLSPRSCTQTSIREKMTRKPLRSTRALCVWTRRTLCWGTRMTALCMTCSCRVECQVKRRRMAG